jgi:phage shock protein A
MQTLLQRINTLVSANAHHLVDQLEEPERMLAQALRDLDQEMLRVKSRAVRALAAEKLLGRQIDQLGTRAGDCATTAERALLAGNEDRARLALERQLAAESDAKALEPTLERAKQNSATLRRQLDLLRDARRRAAHKRLALTSRHRLAQAQRAAAATLDAQPVCSIDDAWGRMGDLEDRIAAEEAEAEAAVEITDAGLDANPCDPGSPDRQAVDDALEALRTRLNGHPGDEPSRPHHNID